MNLFHGLFVWLSGFRTRPLVRRSAIIYNRVVLPKSCVVGERVKMKGKDGRFPVLGKDVFVNDDCIIWGDVRIGKHTRLNPKAFVQDCNHDVFDLPAPVNGRTSIDRISKPVVIGCHVTLDSCCVVCKGVTIGDGAIVMAGAVVFDDVPVRAVVQGNPAKIVGYRKNKVVKKE